MNYKVTLPELGRTIEAPAGRTLLEVLRAAGCAPEAPCGGKGVCGKCRVRVNGAERLACQTVVDGPATVSLPELAKRERILTGGCEQADAEPAEPVGAGLLLAFDIGTTTIAGYLMDEAGTQIATGSRLNPQAPFGSDVITRIQLALKGEQEALTRCVREALADLTCELLNAVKREADALGTICVVGNPCMQQLFLGISPKNLAGVPFAPVLTQTEISRAGDVIALWGDAALLTVPDISGYVGADTVGCVLATQMDRSDEITLMVDIGTNGEMVMGSRARMVACSTAAGPALEGANIRFGMRAADGAIDHVTVENGEICCHVLGGGEARGICGSGLIDAVVALKELGLVNRRGRLQTQEQFEGDLAVRLSGEVWLTQNDVRQMQLAKGAISAGIGLMARHLGIEVGQIDRLLLAGAFGSFIRVESACRIGLLPQELLEKAQAIGNAAGSGAKRAARSRKAFEHTQELAREIEFLELASLPDFQHEFARGMWI